MCICWPVCVGWGGVVGVGQGPGLLVSIVQVTFGLCVTLSEWEERNRESERV